MAMNSDAQNRIKELASKGEGSVIVTEMNQGRRVVFSPKASQPPTQYTPDTDAFFDDDQEERTDDDYFIAKKYPRLTMKQQRAFIKGPFSSP